MIGIESNDFNGITEYYIANLNSTKNILAILISITGKNPTITKFAKHLKERGIYTIVILTFVDTELSEICDELLQINDNKLILSRELLPIIISTQYIIDIMISIY